MAIVTWIILAVILVVVFILLKANYHGEKVKVIALILIGLLLYFSITSLFNKNDVDLKSAHGVADAVYMYVGWVGRTITDLATIGKDAVGSVKEKVSFNISDDS